MGEVSHDAIGVVSIDNRNPDYWQWGLNCKLLGFTNEQTQCAVSHWEDSMSREQRDLFWEGYVNGRPPQGHHHGT